MFKIRALISFGSVKAGDEGGYIEKEGNLSQVFGNAQVYGNAQVFGNANIFWTSKVGGELGTLTAFRDKDGKILVTRGCFYGTLDEFRNAVIKKHGGTLHEKAYLGLANYIEFHFTELHPFKP